MRTESATCPGRTTTVPRLRCEVALTKTRENHESHENVTPTGPIPRLVVFVHRHRGDDPILGKRRLSRGLTKLAGAGGGLRTWRMQGRGVGGGGGGDQGSGCVFMNII